MNYCYIKGDKAQYTGHSEMIYGELCYEVILLEGHLKGQKKWTYRAPVTNSIN